jgi:hypothetical protein
VQAQAQQQQQSAAFSAVAAAANNNTSATSSYFFTSPVSRRGSVASLLQSSAVEEEEEEPPLSPASARSSSDERERQSPTASSSVSSEFTSPFQQHQHHVSSRYTTPTRRQRSLSMGRRISVDVPPMERLAGRITMVVTPPRGDQTTTTTSSSTNGAGGATGLAQAGATATGGASSGAGATSGAPLNWPSVQPNISRMRFDLPPTKLHCQSPEQRACAAHHTNPLLVDAPVPPSSTDVTNGHSSAVSAYPSPKCWCPFASDVYAVGVIVYEMSTGARWNAQSMEPLVAEYHNSKTAAVAKQQQQQITAVVADGDTDELMCSSPTAHVRSSSPTPAAKDAAATAAAPTIPAGVDPLAWDLVCHCTAPESARIKSAELMHHAFFTRQAATATAAA